MAKVTDIDSPRTPVRTRGRSSKHSVTRELQWEKAKAAYELVLAGKSHSEIAELLEIPHVDDVWRMMTEMFKSDASYLSDEERKDTLAREILRLNALQAAVWPSAMMGDPKSIDTAVKIIQTRAKITGLELTDPLVQKNLVLVMGEKEDDYIKALQQASQDR